MNLRSILAAIEFKSKFENRSQGKKIPQPKFENRSQQNKMPQPNSKIEVQKNKIPQPKFENRRFEKLEN